MPALGPPSTPARHSEEPPAPAITIGGPGGRAVHRPPTGARVDHGPRIFDYGRTCIGLAVSLLVGSPATAAGEVRAGVAREAFELPAHVPLAGYSRRKGKPSASLHDPVDVRALVLEDGETAAALVSCDLLIIDERLFETVRSRLTAQGLPPQLILVLAATHTHSGPGAYGAKFLEKISMGHFDPEVFNALAQTITAAVTHAYVGRAPVRLAYGAAQTEGLVHNRVEPDGLIDPELIVVGWYRTGEQEPFAVLVNFAAHPTALGAWNMEVSADYPGVVRRQIERRFPGATCLFFAGAVGDQAPVKSGDGFGRAESVGLPLAQQAVALIEQARPETVAALHARQERLTLPPAQLRAGRLAFPRWLGKRLVDDDATLSVVEVGTAAFMGVPCDLAASLGASLKEAARAKRLNPVIIGFASDYIGYCVPEALYEAKKYESSMAFNGPKAGELVVERLKQMVDRLPATGQ